MSTKQGPKTYTIRLFSDLLKVPKSRRGQCIHDLMDGMEGREELAAQTRESAAFGEVAWTDDGGGRFDHEFANGERISVGGTTMEGRT